MQYKTIKNAEFHFVCKVCLDDGNYTEITLENGIFEHDAICVYCSSDLDWVAEQYAMNENLGEFSAYKKVREHNEKLLAQMITINDETSAGGTKANGII